jgi:hypothetical protein
VTVESGGGQVFDGSYNYRNVQVYQGATQSYINGASDSGLTRSIAKVKSRDLPVVADVEDGVVYAGGELEGTLAVSGGGGTTVAQGLHSIEAGIIA